MGRQIKLYTAVICLVRKEPSWETSYSSGRPFISPGLEWSVSLAYSLITPSMRSFPSVPKRVVRRALHFQNHCNPNVGRLLTQAARSVKLPGVIGWIPAQHIWDKSAAARRERVRVEWLRFSLHVGFSTEGFFNLISFPRTWPLGFSEYVPNLLY